MLEIVHKVMLLSTVGGVLLVFVVPLFLKEEQEEELRAFITDKYLPMYVAMMTIFFIVHIVAVMK
ncbi:MAG: hypothetical protein IJT73_03605 [Selenomonadaceae bacterium]|nr:hypothetical protein [Selenomonadaceae bacterium]